MNWNVLARTMERACMQRVVSPAARASHFCFGKSGQNHCAGHGGLADIVPAKLTSVLAYRAPARIRPSMASDMRVFPARSVVRLGAMQRRGEQLCFVDGHPWPAHRTLSPIRVSTP
jgi:hypothetical protein